MLGRNLFLITIAAVAMSQVPKFIVPPGGSAEAVVVQQAKAESAPVVTNGSYVLDANQAGHFSGNFMLNGRSVHGMVDTGATFVAMNETTARSLGFTGNSLDFRYAVNTANGPAQAAQVTLDRVEIGGVRAEGVEAFVLKDDALDGTLIGMSFLRKLKSFSVEDGRMRLKQ